MDGPSSVNPIDVLEVCSLVDQVSDDLRTMRIGLKCLRKSWRISRAGLLPAARAASSAAVLMAECSALLSYMAANDGELSPEVQTMRSFASETSSTTSALDDAELECEGLNFD